MSKFRIRQTDYGYFHIERRKFLLWWEKIPYSEFIRTNAPFKVSHNYESLEDAEKTLKVYLKNKHTVKPNLITYYEDPADTKVGKELVKEVTL